MGRRSLAIVLPVNQENRNRDLLCDRDRADLVHTEVRRRLGQSKSLLDVLAARELTNGKILT